MTIIAFKPAYIRDFRKLNIVWLEELFYVEPHEEAVLGDPEKYIINPGGTIFFAKEKEEIIGTVALMKLDKNSYELTKMAVDPAHRGKKIGQKLMEHSLNYARQQNWNEIIIYSSRKLENAVYIYKKYGFEEIPIGNQNPYSRGDIKLRLKIS